MCLCVAALFADEVLKQEQEQEQARLNEARKISVVNVNPTNIRPHSDTPEIRKYKKRFNSEILCAALWGETHKPPQQHESRTNTQAVKPRTFVCLQASTCWWGRRTA